MIYFSATPPYGSPGDMWWSGGRLAICIDDATSNQWVQVSSATDMPATGVWDFPDAPAMGEAYTPGGGGVTFTWDGTMWTFPAAAGGAGMITVSDTPPTGVPANTLWWDSNSGDLFVNYNDVDSTQWVQINTAAPATTGIAEAPTDGQQYTRGNTAWNVATTGAGGGLTQADADLRYLQLTAPVAAPVTGALTVNSEHPNFALRAQTSQGFPTIQIYGDSGFQPYWSFTFNDTGYDGDLHWGRSPGNPPAAGSLVDWLTVSRATGQADFALTPTRAGTPLALGTDITSMEERLIARIAALEERLARMEAR